MPEAVEDLPSATLVRRHTDHLVLDALIAHERVTRPGIAQDTGISKPTVSESIRRLDALGIVHTAGKQSGGRGRSGITYELSPTLPRALAVHAGPGEIVTQVVDARGSASAPRRRIIGATSGAADLLRDLASALAEARAASPGPIGAVAASVADPVDRSGRTVLLEGSPFLTESVDLRDALGENAIIGNDVDWAAHAEADAAGSGSFLYCYLGAGIGGAVLDEGHVRSGATGLAGELAYMATRAPDGSCRRLLDCILDLGLRYGTGNAIDLEAVERALRTDPRTAEAIGDAVGTALGSASTVVGVNTLVIGGPWGGHAGLLASVARSANRLSPRPLDVRPALLTVDAPLAGVRMAATAAARRLLHDAVDG